ncbi:MAG: stage II sporulation protein M [Planctomycetes bacterium]|nr:stage II sporulation protein M [Planctomycetota bacterium]
MSARTGPASEAEHLGRLRQLLARSRSGLGALSDAELVDLARLYRYTASRIAWHETRQENLAALEEARTLARAAHALLYRGIDRPREGWWRRAVRFYRDDVPRAVRAEWKLLFASFALVYGLAVIAYAAVRHDLELAYALLSPETVANEIAQLEATKDGEPFRGNFTFGFGQSPGAAGFIMAHNIWVAVLFFAAGLVPPIFVLVLAANGLMLGTYIGVASHWDQAANINSILWCHGTLEMQAFVLAAAAGLVLIRAWIAPGPWSRRHAMARESQRAWRLLAAVFPMLVVAGTIEGFVSPHAGLETRLATAILSGLVLVAWLGFGGRGDPNPVEPSIPQPSR